jgi:hypothetical protein
MNPAPELSDTAAARSYATPWTLRVYEALPGNPFWLGTGFMIGLLLVYFVGRTLVDGAANATTNDVRVTVTQILLTAYAATAYAYLLMTARRSTNDLAPIARHTPQWQTIVDRAGTHPRWVLPLAGAANCLLIGVTATNITTPEAVDPWVWQSWSYDTYWQRATTASATWWMGCLFYVTVVESARLSRLSDAITSLDLLDLIPCQPLIRQGLINALLVIGMASVASLFVVEARYGPMLVGAWIGGVIFAWIALMVPLRGIRRKIRIAKNQELDWCRQTLKTARDELKSGAAEQQSIAEIIAYRTIIENIRNWPFDNPTLVRFALYLLIPLGSWVGGAFVERGLDLFLS